MNQYELSDISIRMSSVLYDSMYSMLSSPTNMTRKLDKVQRLVGGKSVVSSALTAHPESFKDISARITMLETLLENATSSISDDEFQQIVVTCLRADDLYPSFKETFTIAKLMYPSLEATPTQIFKALFLSACAFLTASKSGVTLLKHICTPTSTSQPQFKICRTRFCTKMAENVEYVVSALEGMGKEEEEELASNEDDTKSMASSFHQPKSMASSHQPIETETKSVASSHQPIETETKSMASSYQQNDKDDDNDDAVSIVSSRHTTISRKSRPGVAMPEVLLEEEEDV